MHLSKFLQELSNFGVPEPERDLRDYINYVKGTNYSFLELSSVELSDVDVNKINDFVIRRINKEPFSKIIGVKDFYGLSFKTTCDTLDPRDDSEHIIEAVLKKYTANARLRFIDLGVGTGCLSITLLKYLSNSSAVVVDKSKAALNVSIENAHQHGVYSKLQFLESSWWDQVPPEEFDFIISNPPYIDDDYPLDDSVKKYDPHLALFGGVDGLDAYREILKSAGKYLKDDGFIFLEIGFDQADKIQNLAMQSRFNVVQIIKDYGNNDRVVILKK
jgi:release factor glutamine methyltransferase